MIKLYLTPMNEDFIYNISFMITEKSISMNCCCVLCKNYCGFLFKIKHKLTQDNCCRTLLLVRNKYNSCITQNTSVIIGTTKF